MRKDVIKTIQEKQPEKAGLWKNVALFFIGWFGLSVVATIAQALIMIFSNVPIQEVSGFFLSNIVTQAIKDAMAQNWVDITVNSIAYLAVALVMVAILRTDLVEHLKTFKNGKAYVAGLIGLLLIIVFNNVYKSLVEPLYPITDNVNEESLDSTITMFPVISIFIFGIVGPLVEELTYRVGLYSLLKKKSKILAYILTIIIFASIHFSLESVAYAIDTGNSTWLVNELLNMPTYMFAASVFIYLYDNYGLAGSLSAHMYNNLLSIIGQIILSKL